MKTVTILTGLLPAIVVTAIVTLLAGQTDVIAPLNVSTPSAPCSIPITFTPTYQVEPGALHPAEQGWTFQSTSWLSAEICQPGKLTLRASGQKAKGQSPRLSVFLDSKPLGDFQIEKHTVLNISVPSRGRLTLAYLNDYYSQEARVAFVGQLRLTGSGCSDVRVDVPPETGGHWYKDYGFATLNTGSPLEIIPCRSGQLALALWGRLAGGHFPQIELREGGRPMGVWMTTAKPKQVQLRVTGRPVQVRLVNPYGKLLADRNLYLREWEFQPYAPVEKSILAD